MQAPESAGPLTIDLNPVRIPTQYYRLVSWSLPACCACPRGPHRSLFSWGPSPGDTHLKLFHPSTQRFESHVKIFDLRRNFSRSPTSSSKFRQISYRLAFQSVSSKYGPEQNYFTPMMFSFQDGCCFATVDGGQSALGWIRRRLRFPEAVAPFQARKKQETWDRFQDRHPTDSCAAGVRKGAQFLFLL